MSEISYACNALPVTMVQGDSGIDTAHRGTLFTETLILVAYLGNAEKQSPFNPAHSAVSAE